MKHTKGPWFESGYNVEINPALTYCVVQITDKKRFPPKTARELRANAQLISAAPDMLEALLFVANNHSDELSQAATELMEEAIAKATA